ncbi:MULTISPECIES: methionine ABC transporter ATP-binding protein [Brenneria]|uniref:Cell division ATP-binding protein FtsE n=1 Tax=Brenneria nigrifluens DSM 30175 = ATCC 13028 TaxID=1121120 RepID=A0A2U1UUE2_9GAMM|nr:MULTISPECIES: methionine ABC transporter ATP-binding protein [Brenneria]EHD21967.1 Phosphonate-transporting ATPase [Brenneria sp. EniD312]PWC25304.1 methionine ABC transporter ATP-binding protein [Brenneria nigrifluens DSM 30175 = ATCC 13028]QCR05056.1 methionine ABC transporter ATP-binding protein [Brenneria nigrifluens DSM 30175 = ATCC 13028]
MIQLEGVSVDFPQGKQRGNRAVDNVTLHIRPGEVYGIVGTSGAGKSTLLRTINLLQRPTAGVVQVHGVKVSDLQGKTLRAQRQKMGMIFQHFNLMQTRTVAENVAFSLKAAGKSSEDIAQRVPEILNLVGLADKSAAFPSQLSGGQKQRVGIARAIANHPEVLLCDEPTSALDLETSAAILALLKEINKKLGITIVLISHEMSVIKSICDRVAVMTGGKVVEEGDVFDIFAAPQHPFTRQLVAHTLNLELPPRLLEDLQGTLLKILFVGDSAEQPVLSDVATRFGVSVNILHGKIEYIGNRALGILVALLTHPSEAAKVVEAVEHIRARTAQVEVLHG